MGSNLQKGALRATSRPKKKKKKKKSKENKTTLT